MKNISSDKLNVAILILYLAGTVTCALLMQLFTNLF